ncbi:MAG TPA: cob(I)yrinic acid a,c-diamide adenosyltransferase [Burkholderiales bacterium]|jgi:cob(I)alamin adenosyltransferase|nr:cob(I)yrinic acid a,c-diamide adenosyltransferase [Burkholderiales bacterium]
MGNRLTKIYTRTGDAGTTGLADGSRVAKDAPRIEAIGAVDELNSVIGVLLCEDLPAVIRACLDGVQHDLFDLGGELSVPGHALMSEAHSQRLEQALDAFNADLPALKDFILPGGSRGASLAHAGRTVCRRAERAVVALAKAETVAPPLFQYLNRLSDLLFVISRKLNRHAGRDDVYWQQGKNRG